MGAAGPALLILRILPSFFCLSVLACNVCDKAPRRVMPLDHRP